MARRKVIEWLIHRLEHEVDDDHFRMDMWLAKRSNGEGVLYHSEKDIPYCKTAACMAGTLFLGLPKSIRKGYTKLDDLWGNGAANIQFAAQEQMGLTYEQADQLFSPALWELNSVTRQDAIAVLRHMLDFSTINWCAVAPELPWSASVEPKVITLTDD